MKSCHLILAFISFCLILYEGALAQKPPITSIIFDTAGVETFEPTLKFRGISGSGDIRVFPSIWHQSEESIAINPYNLNNLLIGANVVFSDSVKEQGYYYSFNSGSNWAGDDSLPGTLYQNSDPAVAFDANGNAYFNYLSGRGIYDTAWVRVKKSLDGGINWLPRVTIPNAYWTDKNHMAIDVTKSPYRNNIYIAYFDYQNFPDPMTINISRSTDGGSSFSEPLNISENTALFMSQGVNLSIGPNGEVYAVWAIYDDLDNLVENALGFNKSLNGGADWEDPDRFLEINGIRDLWKHKNNLGNEIRVFSWPSMAVDTSGGIWNGHIYVVWADSMYGDPDILMIKSTDGGETWQEIIRVNDDPIGNGIDQWFPWIDVNPYGVINVVYYDSRNDPANMMTDVWVAQSSDGGETLTNFRISDTASTIPPIIPDNYYWGDYIGITSKAVETYPCWHAVSSSGVYQVYIDKLNTYQADLLALAHSNKSMDANATFSNSARHLVKGAGYLHQVFSSGGEIFYRRSPDDGQSWDETEKITTGNGDNLNASMAYYEWIPDEIIKRTLAVVWERKINNNEYEVWYSTGSAENINWSEPERLAAVTISSTQAGAMPVIDFMNYGEGRIVVVYCSNDGLYYRYLDLSGASWSNPALIFSSNRVRYPCLSGGGNFLSLVYDLRQVDGVFSRIYDGEDWSASTLVASQGITGTKYNRTPSITVDPNGNLLAACRGQIFEDELDPYYSIVFSFGYSDNTWSDWFEVFEHEPGLTSYSPSISYHNIGDYGIDIVYGTTADKVRLIRYDGRNWYQVDDNFSGKWPNITEEGIQSGDPIYCRTNPAGPPYLVEMENIETESMRFGKPSKPVALTDLLRKRRAVISHKQSNAFLVLDVEPLTIQNTTGEQTLLPFKKHQIQQPANISLTNLGDYLGSDSAALPANVQSLNLQWHATVSSGTDSSGTPYSNIFQGKYQLFLNIIDVNNPGNSIVNNITNQQTVTLNIQGFAGRTVIIKPGIQLSNISLTALNFNAGDVYLPVSVTPKEQTAQTYRNLIPATIMLNSNYPNPFNSVTIIHYQLPASERVELTIYNLLGQKVKTLVSGLKPAGQHRVTWDGRDDAGREVASGVYIYRLQAGSYTAVRKMLLLR
ncbi:MAG: hypothetical protein Kow0042_15370 [Calditrichia bacterium]